MSILDKRIIVVTGKGGVGKSTVCAALGLFLAQQGRRTIIAETAGCTAIPPIFGGKARGYKPIPMRPRLHTMSITPEAAIEDYVVQQLHIQALYKLVFRNRVMGPFIEAVPGLHDAIQLGKVFDLERQKDDAKHTWDTIIVDAPATGHGLTMLDAPRAMMELTRAGPVYEGVKMVHNVLDNPETTAVVLVTLPEVMPLRETIEFYERLGKGRDKVALCILNQVLPDPIFNQDEWAISKSALENHDHPGIAEGVQLVETWLRKVTQQIEAATTISDQLPVPCVQLTHQTHNSEDKPPIDTLANELGAALTSGVAP